MKPNQGKNENELQCNKYATAHSMASYQLMEHSVLGKASPVTSCQPFLASFLFCGVFASLREEVGVSVFPAEGFSKDAGYNSAFNICII